MSPAAVLLAESDSGKGSPIGLFVVLLLVIAVYLLYRSMTGHLRRLPEKFPVAGTGDAADARAEETARPAGTTDTDAGTGTPTRSDGERPGPS